MRKKQSGFKVGSNLTGSNSKGPKGARRGKVSKRALKKAFMARERAAYIAKLPKNPWKRFFRRFLPTTWFRYLKTKFGRRHFFFALLGIFAAAIILLAVQVAMVWADVEKRIADGITVANTVNTYYDRNCLDENGKIDTNRANCTVLWEDKGSGDYRLTVESDEISPYAKMATIAIEDKKFYEHGGIDIFGIIRAFFNNIFGGSTQGASTLTQQLVKQVFLSDKANERSGMSGIDRKFREAVMSMIVETKYSKDQILTMYMNQSPYGGRRNGVESASQTYFGKSSKDLTLAEAATIAAIPQNPSLYNPYYVLQVCGEKITELDDEGNVVSTTTDCEIFENDDGSAGNGLVRRQWTTLSYMAEQCDHLKENRARAGDPIFDSIDCSKLQKATDEAKKTDVLATVKPLSDQLAGVKAPHFVQMVKGDLETKLGTDVVGAGGLAIVTTLDWRVQQIVEEEVTDMFDSGFADRIGADNASATMIDSQTGQVLAMQGSRDYNYGDYGSVNEATAYIQPGSSIKPEVYAGLIERREEPTYGAGSLIDDSAIPQCRGNVTGVCYTTADGRSVQNATGNFRGMIPIRQALSESRNVPAIRAMAQTGYNDDGVPHSWDFIRALGDVSYCEDTNDEMAGLSSAIGSCGAKQVEHANAFASFARMGQYRSYESTLSVENDSKEQVYWWEDSQKVEQAIDPQTAFIISDILSDANARAGVMGYCSAGFCINGVKTATKTGTTDTGSGARQKDLWMMSYSPKASLSIWLGNHIPKGLKSGDGMSLGPYIRDIQSRSHLDIFQPDGTWHEGDWFTKPDGVQSLNINGKSDIYPSWYNKNQRTSTRVTLTFDSISHKLATECTPVAARIDIEVTRNYDPATRKESYAADTGWDPDNNDDVHSCSDTIPEINSSISGRYQDISPFKLLSIEFAIMPGNHPIKSGSVTIAGESYPLPSPVISGDGYYRYSINVPSSVDLSGEAIGVSISVEDELLYGAESSGSVKTIKPSGIIP
ncbi:MAG: penicillin-binding protein [Candidatus Nomurabacteria bacterium]|nr:penicillin-binding protein [Candidatus Nomurabacteria bacterium]